VRYLKSMKSITEIQNFEGKRVLLRVDWNVPVRDGEVLDPERIDNSLATINYILDRGGKILIVSHITKEGESLKPAFEYFGSKVPAVFCDDLEAIPEAKLVVLENIRKWEGEKKNEEDFAEKLASKAELYVNDAFSESHRAYASIIGVPKLLPSYAGIYFMEEYQNLSKALSPAHPFIFILGGAKFETKIPLIEKFLKVADQVFVLGAIAKPASETELVNNPKINLPVGDVAALDANQETLEVLNLKITNSKFILWNGPLGKYEEGLTEGTKKLALMLSEICASGQAEVVVGGGDTLAVIKELGIKDKFTFVSSSGCAMLDFLATGTLPGIEALNSV